MRKLTSRRQIKTLCVPHKEVQKRANGNMLGNELSVACNIEEAEAVEKTEETISIETDEKTVSEKAQSKKSRKKAEKEEKEASSEEINNA